MSLNPSPLPPYTTSLDGVPEGIQKQLSIITELVHDNIKNSVGMIWLFGSYARGEAINDRRTDPKTGVLSEYNSDVDILVVVKGPNTMKKSKWWARLDASIKGHPELTSSIHIIRESYLRFADALRHSEYFYVDVVKEGIVLYGDKEELPEPKEFSIEKRKEFAIHYLNRFYQRADASKRALELHYQSDDPASAMYCLHQLSERLFYTLLLVFTHYKPRSHKLDDLRERIATIDKRITSIFPLNDKSEQERFQFLNDAYVDSRYNDDYEVDPEVLDYLIVCVAEFQAWVLAESLRVIDDFIPGENFSDSFEQPGVVLDLDVLKKQKLPLIVIHEQLEALKGLEDRLDEKEAALLKADQEKVEALAREKESLAREQSERSQKESERAEKEASLLENERLLKKLRDAGLEP